MKAKIVITPKKAVLDPQGKTVQAALEQMGYEGVKDVHVGKYLEIELEGDAEVWRPRIDEACDKLLQSGDRGLPLHHRVGPNAFRCPSVSWLEL